MRDKIEWLIKNLNIKNSSIKYTKMQMTNLNGLGFELVKVHS
jgi:hypothetical protein